MFIAGEYLFSGQDLNEVFQARHRQVREAVDALDSGAFKAGDGTGLAQSLVTRFSIDEPGMKIDKSYFLDERALDPTEVMETDPSNPDPSSESVAMKAVTIAIPITGDESMFQCRPAMYSVHQPQAEIADHELRICFLITEFEEQLLEQRFEQQLALIERQLEVTQWQIKGFNSELPEFVHGVIAARRPV